MVAPRWTEGTCDPFLDVEPGFLSAFFGETPGENIALPDGLGHVRMFRVAERYREDGAFFDGAVYRPYTAENLGYLCRAPQSRQTVFRFDETHFVSICQSPRHILESGRDYIGAQVDMRDGDHMVELFLAEHAETSADWATSDCSLARALIAFRDLP